MGGKTGEGSPGSRGEINLGPRLLTRWSEESWERPLDSTIRVVGTEVSAMSLSML